MSGQGRNEIARNLELSQGSVNNIFRAYKSRKYNNKSQKYSNKRELQARCSNDSTYVNVQNPKGEIRGQIIAGSWPFLFYGGCCLILYRILRNLLLQV